MSYDEQSQMGENTRCQARANSPLMKTFSGLRKYLQLGVGPRKLVLGTPWYGYRYPCQGIMGTSILQEKLGLFMMIRNGG